MVRNRGQFLREFLQGVALIIAAAASIALALALLHALMAQHYWP
jgi:hypothetical protein